MPFERPCDSKYHVRLLRWFKSWGTHAHFIRLPLMVGPIHGCWWLPASRGKLARILTGRYEPEQTEVFRQHVGPGDVLIDVGANVGYYTLLASRLIGASGRVVALEPSPSNALFLRKHIRLNCPDNALALACAVGDTDGTVHFKSQLGTGRGYVDKDGDVEVRMRSLDSIVKSENLRPTHIKIDVEGAEIGVLRGARRTLTNMRPTLFLSTHGRERRRACIELLQSLDYTLQPLHTDDIWNAGEALAVPREKWAKRVA